jgi:HEAT repeat protein
MPYAPKILTAALVAVAIAAAAPAQDATEFFDRGHAALDAERYREAAELFAAAAEAAPEGEMEAEARYWHAFALHRQGGKDELREAAEELLRLRELEQNEALRSESLALAARIKAELARQGDAGAARELAAMVEEHEDLELKLMALQSMVHMKPERALPVLREILTRRDSMSAPLRTQALLVLGQSRSDEAVDLMLEIARDDPDDEVREQATFWLGQTGSPRALEFFRQMIRSENDPEVLEHVLFAASQFPGEEAGELLREIVADAEQSPEVREAAILGLGHSGSAADHAFLRDVWDDLEDAEVRETILHAVAMGDDPQSVEWMTAIALDEAEDVEVRKMALFWAGQQGTLPIERLAEIYASSPDRELREQAIFVLSQSADEAALEQLMQIASEETDLELRKQAIFWIGQSSSERAEEFLLELIAE